MAASLWSALPDENAMQIRERILRYANRYTVPDNNYGYGIPNAWAAYTGTTDIPCVSTIEEAHKVLINNELRIIIGTKTYNILGKEMELNP